MCPVEDEAADHGARHAAHHDHQPDQPRVLRHSLGNSRDDTIIETTSRF